MDQFIPTLSVAGILGFLAPLVSSALKRSTFSAKTNQIIAIVVSVLLAVIAILITDGFSTIPGNENPVIFLLTCALVVIAVAQIAYRLLWIDTPIEHKLAAIGAPNAANPAANADYQGKHEA